METPEAHAQNALHTQHKTQESPFIGDGANQKVSPEEIERAASLLDRIYTVLGNHLVGQFGLQQSLVSTMIAGGHILLESVPGLAKTTAAHALARGVSGSFHRIQCTPDLMPNDIVGTQIFNYSTNEFTTQLGPVHANFVLLDEINRSSAKTQSAMLEAMQEKQTSIGGEIYPLPKPFMVLATQNPIEEEGTYVLPEAQMDRFLVKAIVTYPEPDEEVDILKGIQHGSFTRQSDTSPISLEDLQYLQQLTNRIYVDDSIKRYIVAIINATRNNAATAIPGLAENIRVGASPRGSIALMSIGQAVALQAGREYVTPDDIKAARYVVLRHRVLRTYDALANDVSVESIIDAIFESVPTP